MSAVKLVQKVKTFPDGFLAVKTEADGVLLEFQRPSTCPL
jgi:hypothetical protein